MKFHGAETTLPEDPTKQSLRVYIESSGPFVNRRDGRLDTFVTKAMSQRTYQYNLVTGKYSNQYNLVTGRYSNQ